MAIKSLSGGEMGREGRGWIAITTRIDSRFLSGYKHSSISVRRIYLGAAEIRANNGNANGGNCSPYEINNRAIPPRRRQHTWHCRAPQAAAESRGRPRLVSSFLTADAAAVANPVEAIRLAVRRALALHVDVVIGMQLQILGPRGFRAERARPIALGADSGP